MYNGGTVLPQMKMAGGVRMRFISETEIPEITPRAVEPTLEDAYVLLLQSSKNGKIVKI